jgi:hypothetical protein
LIAVKRVERERVRIVRADGQSGSLALDRLLACDEKGHGRYYRFQGWKPLPRGYRTELLVVDVLLRLGRCRFLLPEWDEVTVIEMPLEALPVELQIKGAIGSCGACLSSATEAGLRIHDCRTTRVRGSLLPPLGSHPGVLAKKQRFRRRADGKALTVIDWDGSGVRAWNGRRLVSLSRERLMATDSRGEGLHYEYLGGGVWATRRERAWQRRKRG